MPEHGTIARLHRNSSPAYASLRGGCILAAALIKMNEIKPGKYRHFKGNEYEVLFVAKHSETQEEMVVYRALYGERGLWVRPAAMWNETIERDGKSFKRFEYIGD